jgi:hypothetical protein
MNLQNIDRNTLLGLAFVVLSVGSIIYLSVLTANYLAYYPALATITFTASSPKLSHDSTSNQTLLVTGFTVSNPSSYSGLTLRSASTSTYFYDTLNTTDTLLYYNAIVGDAGTTDSLNARSTLSIIVYARVTPEQLTALNQFLNMHNGHVNATSFLRIDISSFLNPVIGHYPYRQVQNYTFG